LTKDKTIMVDGVERAREKSNGMPIGKNDQEIQDFWRMFGNTKFTDDLGRPMPPGEWMQKREEDFELEVTLPLVGKAPTDGLASRLTESMVSPPKRDTAPRMR